MITAEQIEKIRKSGLVAIAGVSVSDILDSLDACETERDRLRAELDAAHDGEDALRSEVTRLRAQIAALQPEERRVGPDEVGVPRSAAEYAIRAFDWIECPDSEHYEAWRAFLDALRTSAQAHNGEGAK